MNTSLAVEVKFRLSHQDEGCLREVKTIIRKTRHSIVVQTNRIRLNMYLNSLPNLVGPFDQLCSNGLDLIYEV